MNDGSTFDVIVCGGGTAGSVAAIRAARLGLRTALVERQSQLGGTSTLGLVTPVMPNQACGVELVAGIHRELHDRLTREGLGETRGFDPIRAAVVLEEMAADAGVTLLYHSELINAHTENTRLTQIDLVAFGQRFTLTADFFIDATGDALLTSMCHLPTQCGREGTGEHQPLSLRFILADVDISRACDFIAQNTPAGQNCLWPCENDATGHTLSVDPTWLEARAADSDALGNWKNQLSFNFYTIPGRPTDVCFNAPRVLCDDPLDPHQLARAYSDGRRQISAYWTYFRKHVPGFETSYISCIAPLIGIREGRRIVGDFILTEQHVRQFARFDDAVCRCSYAIDVHHTTRRGMTLWYLPNDQWYDIPYRAMLPKTITNLIVAGRCLSSDFIAHSSYRIVPVCRGLGEAAALACNIAKTMRVDLHSIPGHALKHQLLELGIMITPNHRKTDLQG